MAAAEQRNHEACRYTLRVTIADPSPAPTEPKRREICERCRRPESVCYCASLVRLETRSKIVILQHPRERGMPIGTAYIAHLCLPQSSLHVGVTWDESDVLKGACGDPERPAILLYPGPDARDILAEPPATPVTLIVVDGTWSQARTLVRDNPKLAALPRYAFHAPEPSNYRIRPEPSDAYVSTLEALMHVLGALEGDPTRFLALREPMEAMVEAQLAAQAVEARPRVRVRLRQRRTRHERLPTALRFRSEELVLVYGDANAWPHGSAERALGDELIYWVACRPHTGETFSFILRPHNALAPDVPGHVGLSAEALEAGGTFAELQAAFAAFLRPDDVLASWGHHGLRMFKDGGGRVEGEYVDLRDAARVLHDGKIGSVERYASEHGSTPREGLPGGRAGRRLGYLLGLVERCQALTEPAAE